MTAIKENGLKAIEAVEPSLFDKVRNAEVPEVTHFATLTDEDKIMGYM